MMAIIGNHDKQQRDEPRNIVAQRTRGDDHALVIQALHQRRVAWRISIELTAVGERAVNIRALDPARRGRGP